MFVGKSVLVGEVDVQLETLPTLSLGGRQHRGR